MAFTTTRYLQRFDLTLPDFLASWDVWEYWERPRIEHMEANLKQGDLLFDIGVEAGWMSLVFAKFVGAENMVLFESTPEYWPNIRQTWEANGLELPRACFCGLVGNENRNSPMVDREGWPVASEGEMTKARSYKYIHEHGETSPQIRLDEFCQLTGLIPNAITMDIEGAELNALKGAERLLLHHKPKVWASLHPDLMLKNYMKAVRDVEIFMDNIGYESHYLTTDHEVHMYYEPKES